MPNSTFSISRRILCGAIAFFGTALGAHAAPSAEEVLTVRMEGYADGVGLAARNAALENAKQEVIRKVLNSIVADGDFSHLRNVLRSASLYLRGYDMLRQDIVGDGTRVEIDAYVEAKDLYQDVAVAMLPHLEEKPRVLLVVGEQLGDDKIVGVPDFGYAENALRAPLEKYGLKVEGVDAISGKVPQPELIHLVNGEVEEGGTFAKGNDADVVIIGTAITVTEPPADGTNVHRNRSTVSVRVYRALDGDLVDAFTKVAAVSSVDPMEGAIQATNDACEKIINDITVAAVLTVLGTQPDDRVLLTVEEPQDATNTLALAETLRHELGEDKVEVILDSKALARLRIQYDGDMLPFVELLTSEEYAGRHLAIRHAVGREVVAYFR